MIKARQNWIWCSGITTIFLVGVACCGHAVAEYHGKCLWMT